MGGRHNGERWHIRIAGKSKKTPHVKTQVIIERNSQQIIDVLEAKGSEHDFKVYKDTIGKPISNSIPVDADLGYLGIEEYHSNSFIPVKSSKSISWLYGKKRITNGLQGGTLSLSI